MKILHVVEPFSSGITTFIISITQELPQHEHTVYHGARVTVDKLESVRSRFPNYVRFKEWRFAVRPIQPLNDLMAFIILFNHIVSNKYDVIHLHSAKAGFLGRIVGLFVAGKKMIYTPNGAPFLRKDVGNFKKCMFRFLEQAANYLSGSVICCGQSESDVYSAIGVENNYINNGVRLKGEIIKKNDNRIKIVCVGILSFQKNPLQFTRIAEHFKGDPRLEFVWVGDGPLRSVAEKDCLTITGWRDSNEVQSYLADADIYLSTSLWEGQPFAVLEAMNNSCCLLLKACVGNIDLVDNGINGYLFDDATQAISYIEKLLEDSRSIIEHGLASNMKCRKEHDQVIMGKAYEEQYFKISRQ